jgi:hypothetical protein
MKDIAFKTLLAILWTLFGFGVPVIHAQGGTPPPEIIATGGVSASLIAQDEDLRFWITIQNKSSSEMSQIRLIRLPEGYDIKEVCFFLPQSDPAHPQEDKLCADTEQLGKRDVTMALAIPAGQTLTGSGRLKPYGAHKKETLTLVLEWTAKGKPASSLTVALGENQVQNSWQDWSSSWFYQLLKDLALPVVLLGLGTWLNLSTKRRDARSETLKLMLPVSHKYAAKYYLPLSRATERAVDALYEITEQLQLTASPLTDPAKLDSALRKSFFYVLLVKRNMEGLRKQVGGWYFKDLRGESLASACVRKFEALLGTDTDDLSLSIQRLAGRIAKTETYESFETRFWPAVPASPLSPDEIDAQRAWSSFEPWALNDATRQQAIQYLSALTIVLDFEANRPYKYWYDEMEKLEPNRLNKEKPTPSYVNVESTLQEFASGDLSRKKINEYLKG